MSPFGHDDIPPGYPYTDNDGFPLDRDQCPACGSRDHLDAKLVDLRICKNCLHEWAPAHDAVRKAARQVGIDVLDALKGFVSRRHR